MPGMFHLCSLQEAQSLNLHASIPLISFIHGRFYFKSIKSLLPYLFAAYGNPTPAISQLWYEPCEQIIRISGYNSFLSSPFLSLLG